MGDLILTIISGEWIAAAGRAAMGLSQIADPSTSDAVMA